MSGKRLLALTALIAGIYAALCPIWYLDPANNNAMVTMIVLGVITAALALASLYVPGVVLIDSLLAFTGVLFLIAPWVMDFNTGYTALAWTAWIVGGVALVAGAAEFQLDRAVHRGMVTSQ